MNYLEMLERYEELEWQFNDIMPQYALRGNSYATERARELIHELHPRMKFENINPVKHLEKHPEEKGVINSIIVSEWKDIWHDDKLEHRELNRKLWEMAETYREEPSEEWQKVASSSVSTYSTQGYSAHKYAREALTAMEIAIELEGFESYVECEGDYSYSQAYVLYAKCSKAMLDASLRKNALLIEEQLMNEYNERGVNRKVIHPMWKGEQ